MPPSKGYADPIGGGVLNSPGSAPSNGGQHRLGLALVGVGGSVGSTVVAGTELMRLGAVGTEGLPLADGALRTPEPAAGEPSRELGLTPYTNLVVAGWDLTGSSLDELTRRHGILTGDQLAATAPVLSELHPWPAVAAAPDGRGEPLLAQVERVRADLTGFRAQNGLAEVVVVNLASTEPLPDSFDRAYESPAAFERALACDDPAVLPGMVYAYAALLEGMPYINFTPNLTVDIPALIELAEERGVPVAGKDGKTGQTFLKSALAPALRSRGLRVEGWFSTNLLGNGDGRSLRDPGALASKVASKSQSLTAMLGYPVDDHVVTINFYAPRGDDKEAWDSIDVVGFLGRRMQLKVNLLCSDSLLAAPLVLDLARLLELAKRHGESGVQDQLGAFFKAPTPTAQRPTAYDLPTQERRLVEWLAGLAEVPA
jgi:myo-inositol-1-phosphate synthase